MALRKLQIVFGACGATLIVSALWAQQATGQATPSPRDTAIVDYTGYWVSVITEDWRFRMLTAPKGDTAGVPLNAEGTKAANGWDPAKDISSGEQCRAFGAGGGEGSVGDLEPRAGSVGNRQTTRDALGRGGSRG